MVYIISQNFPTLQLNLKSYRYTHLHGIGFFIQSACISKYFQPSKIPTFQLPPLWNSSSSKIIRKSVPISASISRSSDIQPSERSTAKRLWPCSMHIMTSSSWIWICRWWMDRLLSVRYASVGYRHQYLSSRPILSSKIRSPCSILVRMIMWRSHSSSEKSRRVWSHWCDVEKSSRTKRSDSDRIA